MIVVATLGSLFDEALRGAGVDTDAARTAGRYLDLDAKRDVVEVHGRRAAEPDAVGRGPRLAHLASGRWAPCGSHLGEMVATCGAEGNAAAAIALEDLWNDLGHSHDFSLFCALPG